MQACTQISQNRESPSTVDGRSQARNSSGCGSMPTQRPASGDRRRQTGTESGTGDGVLSDPCMSGAVMSVGTSAACNSCSDRTSMSPRIAASIPCTAAEAPCTVVMHGMFIATAAERISYPSMRGPGSRMGC